MSYQVLARKWRPRTFETLVGQEHVVRALTNALDRGQLHHAYLFSGTRGVGKTTLARILAKSLNCESGVSARPCEVCAACTEIDAGRYVDLIEVDAATNTRVDEMRQLLDNAVYAPTRGRYKVYVIDEVHMLSTSAFNAMLKTLEEPPEHIKFILATTDPQKIPVTVLSRCLQFNLKHMAAPAIEGHLRRILEAEGVPVEGAAPALIAASARGSMRDALSLLDQAIAYGAGRVEEAATRAMLGTVDNEFLLALLETVSAGDAGAAMALAQECESRNWSFDAALQQLGALIHRVALAQMAPAAIPEGALGRERIVDLGRRFDAEELQLLYQIVLHGRKDLPLAPDETAGFTMTLMRMIAFRPQVDSVNDPPFVAGNPSMRADSAPGTEPDLFRDAADWPGLARKLGLSGMAQQLARQSELQRVDGDTIALGLAASLRHLAERPYLDQVQSALSAYFRRPIRVSLKLGSNGGDTAMGRAATAIHQDAFVRELVENFDATVVKSSIKPV